MMGIVLSNFIPFYYMKYFTKEKEVV